jgi:hypothetical protein
MLLHCKLLLIDTVFHRKTGGKLSRGVPFFRLFLGIGKSAFSDRPSQLP